MKSFERRLETDLMCRITSEAYAFDILMIEASYWKLTAFSDRMVGFDRIMV